MSQDALHSSPAATPGGLHRAALPFDNVAFINTPASVAKSLVPSSVELTPPPGGQFTTKEAPQRGGAFSTTPFNSVHHQVMPTPKSLPRGHLYSQQVPVFVREPSVPAMPAMPSMSVDATEAPKKPRRQRKPRKPRADASQPQFEHVSFNPVPESADDDVDNAIPEAMPEAMSNAPNGPNAPNGSNGTNGSNGSNGPNMAMMNHSNQNQTIHANMALAMNMNAMTAMNAMNALNAMTAMNPNMNVNMNMNMNPNMNVNMNANMNANMNRNANQNANSNMNMNPNMNQNMPLDMNMAVTLPNGHFMPVVPWATTSMPAPMQPAPPPATIVPIPDPPQSPVAGEKHTLEETPVPARKRRAPRKKPVPESPMLHTFTVKRTASRKQQTQAKHVPGRSDTDATATDDENQTSPSSDNPEGYHIYVNRQKKDKATQESVWTPAVEAAFMEALWLMPRTGRQKVSVGGRPRGRNELISDFILMRTKEFRTRKQVSSHIQVLKKVLVTDKDFMNLVFTATKSRSKDDPDPSPEDDERYGTPDMESDTFGDLVMRMVFIKKDQPRPGFVVAAKTDEHLLLVDNPAEAEVLLRECGAFERIEESSDSDEDDRPHHTHHQSSPTKSLVVSPKPKKELARPTYRENFTYKFPPPSKSPPAPAPPPKQAPKQQQKSQPAPKPSPAAAAVIRQERRHRRTTSVSIDLGTDRVMPCKFSLLRRVGPESFHCFSRLLRAHYESPLKPRSLSLLLPHFNDLAKLVDDHKLAADVQIIHATVRLHLESKAPAADGDFIADTQFIVSNANLGSGPSIWSPSRHSDRAVERVTDHTWSVRTVVSSRNTELLRSEQPCQFHELPGRPYERLSVPFRPEFWSEFLARIAEAPATAALEALKVSQYVYYEPVGAKPVGATKKQELAFVLLYEFEQAEDQFSGHTIFRRVRHPLERGHQQQPSQLGRGLDGLQPPLGIPPPTSAATLSPPVFLGSPRAAVGSNSDLLTSLGVQMSPFVPGPQSATLPNNEYGLLGERIQRTMTAFEPAAWDDMHDWIFD